MCSCHKCRPVVYDHPPLWPHTPTFHCAISMLNSEVSEEHRPPPTLKYLHVRDSVSFHHSIIFRHEDSGASTAEVAAAFPLCFSLLISILIRADVKMLRMACSFHEICDSRLVLLWQCSDIRHMTENTLHVAFICPMLLGSGCWWGVKIIHQISSIYVFFYLCYDFKSLLWGSGVSVVTVLSAPLSLTDYTYDWGLFQDWHNVNGYFLSGKWADLQYNILVHLWSHLLSFSLCTFHFVSIFVFPYRPPVKQTAWVGAHIFWWPSTYCIVFVCWVTVSQAAQAH